MKAFLLLAALAAGALPAHGQDSSAAPPGQFASITVLHDLTGAATVRVRNSGKAPITGISFVYTFHRSPTDTNTYGASTGYYDSLTDPQTAQAIEPGAEITLPFRFGGNGMYAKVSLAAALFADGTAQGEKGMVQKVLQRRGYMQMTLTKSINELAQASKDGQSREQIAMQFQMAMNDEMGAGLDPELVSCIQNVRSNVIATLRGARQPDGSAVPTATLVQSLLESLRARRDALKP
jgi:hypothetical protein